MEVKVTKDTVAITEYTTVNGGETGINLCHFQLPEEFSDLTVTAAFNNIPVPVINGECLIPTLKRGTVVLGVYAYREGDEGVTLMYSPKPTAFYVNEGSYIEEPSVEERPTVGEYEKYCTMFSEYLAKRVEGHERVENRVTEITEDSTHNQYPTARAVFELAGERDEIEVLEEVAIDVEHTHKQGYSAKAIDDALVMISEIIEESQQASKPPEKFYEYIATLTVVPDSDGKLPTKLSITRDWEGNPFELTDIYCEVLLGMTDGGSGRFYINAGGVVMLGNANLSFSSDLRKWWFRYDSFGENQGGLCTAPNGSLASSAKFPSPNCSMVCGQPVPIGQTLNINKLELVGQVAAAKTFVEGTTITLWGVRK